MNSVLESIGLYVGLLAGVAMIFVIILIVKNKQDDIGPEE